MPEILPAVTEEDSNTEPQRRLQDPIRHLRQPHLPRRKAVPRVPVEEKRLDDNVRDDRGLVRRNSARTATEKARMIFPRLANGPSIDAHGRQDPGNGPASLPDPARPDGDVVLLLSIGIARVSQITNGQPQCGLNQLLHDHGTQHFGGGDAVAMLELGGGVDAVVGEVVFGGDDVEDEGHEPVGYDGEKEREVEIGEVGDEGGFGVECVWGERWEGGCLVRHDDGGSIWGGRRR